MTDAFALIERHESLRLKPYRDSVGKLTIGIGRNLDDCGISESEAQVLLENDVHVCEQDLMSLFSGWADFSEARAAALLDMRFNLGPLGFRKFVNLIVAVKAGNWLAASGAALASKWATQVGQRAQDDAELLRTGEFAS